jgi:serine/threonine-protein kinase HipA
MKLFVYIDGPSAPQLVGTTYVDIRRGKTSSTFSYADSFLSQTDSFEIDPELPLVAGAQAVSSAMPRVFSDAAPDRWGRNLITREAAITSQESGQPTRQLNDYDYLLGVSDNTRQGALRFCLEPEGEFLGKGSAIPPIVELPALLHAARQVDADSTSKDAVKSLFNMGSASLGGARPKASVIDDGELWIAKFPSRNDDHDISAWEKTALDLAAESGLRVPERRLVRIGNDSVLLVKRFDRARDVRVPYMSAMTLCGLSDGQTGDYLDFADSLAAVSANPESDLRELWNRIAFTILVHNTDDHLRNHGLLRSAEGWRLSPLFDVNPNPDMATLRATGLAGTVDQADSLSTLQSMASAFAMTEADARDSLTAIRDALSSLKRIASQNSVTGRELAQLMETVSLVQMS